MNGLLELAARCEDAEGPDRELDREIWFATTATMEDRANIEIGREAHGEREAEFRIDRLMDGRRYTASLDAAMALVPESDETRAVFWRLGNDGEGGNPGDFKAEVLAASTYSAKTFCGLADTAPLALCAAALRARGEEVAK